jgi:hypothetical protein
MFDRVRRRHAAALGLIGLAMAARLWHLPQLPFWVDEAESSINALTILEHGYPTDTFLGQPIFENMLVRPWPDHPEFEFRDISYSDRGMAVYHGWLPLYAIAASFKLFGIEPPAVQSNWHLKADIAAMKWKTVSARAPSVLFSFIFLAALYRAANRMAGRDAGLAALVLAGLSSSLIIAGNFARYHPATLAWSALAAGGIWRVTSRGRRRDHVALGVSLVLLFHTHLFAFLTVAGMAALACLSRITDRARTIRAAVMLAAVAAACLPWFVLSGLLEHMPVASQGPRLLDLTLDVRDYAADRIPYVIAYSLGTGWLLVVLALHGRQWLRALSAPWQRHRPQYLLLLAWMVTATVLWLAFTPPASAWPDRLSLCLFVPGTLLLSLLLADASRMLTEQSLWMAPGLAAAFLAASGLLLPRPVTVDTFAMIGDTLDTVGRLDLPPTARVYASPNSHLIFAFYGERPIQSLAPVRKAVLDAHPSDVVFIESWLYPEFAWPDPQDVARAAARRGTPVNTQEAQEWSRRLNTRAAATTLALRVQHVVPPLDPIPPFAEDAVAAAVAKQAPFLAMETERFGRLPVFRGYPITGGTDLWTTFAYRLVDPRSRSGANLNARSRLSCATGIVVPNSSWVVYHSPVPCQPDRTSSRRPYE